MCLIIFSPDAKLPPHADVVEAAQGNPDGIGIMSARGVQKFLGRKRIRKAWRVINELASDAIPFAVHFRWATHGDVTPQNVHPFPVPGANAMLMHNGVLCTAAKATREKSDTRIFADEVAPKYLLGVDCPTERRTGLERESSGNRLLLMLGKGEAWEVLNRSLWTERHGCLYSNTYCIQDMAPPRWPGRGDAILDNPGFEPLPSGWTQTRDWRDERDLTVVCDAFVDGDSFIASEECDKLWDDEYSMWIRRGYTFEDAEDMADDYVHRIAQDLDMAREQDERDGYYADPPSSGFDWHDSSTWAHHPIPGTAARNEKPRIILPPIVWKGRKSN